MTPSDESRGFWPTFPSDRMERRPNWPAVPVPRVDAGCAAGGCGVRMHYHVGVGRLRCGLAHESTAMANVDLHERELLVLIPGLWMPAWVMLPLGWRLRGMGFDCVRFGYPSVTGSLEENAQRLAGFLRSLGRRPLHLVGHSLGGVLALHTAATRRPVHARSVVMMGSPAAGSRAAQRLGQCAWGRSTMGRTLGDWLAAADPVAPHGVPVGVIAGVRPLGLGAIVARDLAVPHDGVVSVSETQVRGAADTVILPVSHSAVLVSARVARCVGNFVRVGCFDPQSAVPGYAKAGSEPSSAGVAGDREAP